MPGVLPSSVQDLLQEACAELTRRAWPARIVRVFLCGELDVRLQAWHPDRPLVVEVLGPYDGVLPGERWHAVRVEPSGRTVWPGPRRDAIRTGGDLANFVADLLTRAHTEPTASYAS